MLSSIAAAVAAALKGAAAFLQLQLARFKANNAPAMKVNATAQQDQAERDKTTNDVAKKDSNAVADDIAP